MLKRILLIIFGAFSGLALIGAAILLLAATLTYPKLPSLDALTAYQPKIPLRVYSADNVLIGEFGEEKRSFTPIGQTPKLMINALLAAEDERFYRHGGVDYIGVARAMVLNVFKGHAQSGASTITMQVARNFYLSNEKTLSRKFNEALLSFKIERNLTKDQILELYINQIYLGQRAYGFAAAAQTYFGKDMSKLSIAEAAMLAGLPKAPSSINPIANFKRAKQRQLYVLRRMHELKFITDAEYAQAQEAPLEVRQPGQDFQIHAEYVAESVRQMMYERYKEAAYTQGYRVYTSIDSKQQNAAYKALRQGLLDYDQRHGYRGAEGFVPAEALKDEDDIEEALEKFSDMDDLQVGVITALNSKTVSVHLKDGDDIQIQGDGLRLGRNLLSDKAAPASRLRPGAIIRVRKAAKGWAIAQLPQVEGAIVAMDPDDGAIKAMVGGFDFNRASFNHVTQAWRQPGSSFKPFIYSAALERGITPATQINDAPLSINPDQVGGQKWEPKNYDGKFAGPMSVRNALTLSKNLVSIRILQAISPQYAQEHIARFGFSAKNHPAYLTMALGAGSVTPMQMAEAYSVFANTGFLVHHHLITRIEDSRGRTIAKMEPEVAGKNAARTLDARNAFVMTNMMRDVVRFGTAAKARSLGRGDLAGKTGTTNDSHDAWFAGFQPKLVAVVWVGFDQPKSLGSGETGGGAALPVWINFMSSALKNQPEYSHPMPDGVVAQSQQTERGTSTEYFFKEHLQTNPELGLETGSGSSAPLEEVKELLF